MRNKIATTFPVMTTERLMLRQPAESDGQDMFILRSDTTVNKYLDRKPSETEAEAVSFIKKVNENFQNMTSLYWVITQRDLEKFIGTICLYDFSEDGKKCEIGYELLPTYQGQGMMQEAVRKIIEFTFGTLGLDTIEACTHVANHRSTKLLQDLLFEQTTMINEADPNLIVFRLTKQEWKRKNGIDENETPNS